jgi:hypothetical protein
MVDVGAIVYSHDGDTYDGVGERPLAADHVGIAQKRPCLLFQIEREAGNIVAFDIEPELLIDGENDELFAKELSAFLQITVFAQGFLLSVRDIVPDLWSYVNWERDES